MATATLISATLGPIHNEVIFTVLDDAGVVHGPTVEFRPLAENTTTFLTAVAAAMAASLIAGEIASNIDQIVSLGSLAAPKFVYSTAVANVAALRAAYASATQLQAVMIGDFLNSLTDAQLESAFGLTSTQVATLRTNRLVPAAAVATNVRAAAGQ